MKNKIKKQKYWLTILSFIVPCITLFFIYLLNNIYFGSFNTLLAGDAFHQYVVFHNAVKNVLTENGSLFYNWNIGLGVNFYALAAYYLGSIFTPFVYFFDTLSMPDALYILTLLKFGAIGLSAFISFKNMYKKASPVLVFAISMSYTLMSFITAMSEIIMWLDVFIYLPLIFWGLHRVISLKKNGLYFTSLLILLISNYYFGFMTCIFIGIYFISQLIGNFKTLKHAIFPFIRTSISAGISSLIVLLPVYIDLKTVGESLSKIEQLKTDDTGFFDLIYKNFIGAYDTTQYHALPMIYVGLIPLFLAIIYFTNHQFSLKERIANGGLLAFLIASFYLEPLNLVWQGMHSPNMFLFRFSYLFSLLIVLLALKSAENFNKKDALPICLLIISFSILYLISQIILPKGSYDFIENGNIILTFSFLISYFVLLYCYNQQKITKTFLITLLSLFMVIEAIANSAFMIKGISDEWVYPTRENYQETVKDVTPIANEIKRNNDYFVRTENLNPIVSNDGMTFNLNSISQFSSVRNTDSSGALNSLGYLSSGTNLNLKYSNNTLLADSIFGIRYLLTKDILNRFGYTEFKKSGNFSSYQNQYAASLGVLTPSKISTEKFHSSQLENQKILANYLSNQSNNYFTVNFLEKPIFHNSAMTIKIDSYKWTVTRENASEKIAMTFKTTIPAKQQAYYILEAETDDETNDVQLTINNQTISKRYSESGKYYDLGYYEKETEIEFTVVFPNREQVELYPPKIALLDIESYQNTMSIIQKNAVDFKVYKNKAKANYHALEDATLFLSIPYNQGWSVKIDGKITPIKRLFNGFLGVDVPKGKHNIELVFIPSGFKIGAICFVSGVVIFIGWEILIKRRKGKL